MKPCCFGRNKGDTAKNGNMVMQLAQRLAEPSVNVSEAHGQATTEGSNSCECRYECEREFVLDRATERADSPEVLTGLAGN